MALAQLVLLRGGVRLVLPRSLRTDERVLHRSARPAKVRSAVDAMDAQGENARMPRRILADAMRINEPKLRAEDTVDIAGLPAAVLAALAPMLQVVSTRRE